MESAPNPEQPALLWQGKYGEIIKITEENVDSCYTSAVLHNEGDKQEACIGFIRENLRADNCIRFLNSANETIRDEGFLDSVRNFVLKHVEEAKSRPEFLNLTAGAIDTLLVPITRHDEEHPHLDFSPSELFMSLYEWMSEKRSQRMIKFDKILETFPLALVDLDVLEKVSSDEELQSYPKILKKFLEAVVRKYRKDIMQQRKSKSILGAGIDMEMNQDFTLNNSRSEVVDGASTSKASGKEGDVNIKLEVMGLDTTSNAGSTGSFEIPSIPECDNLDDVVIVDEYCPTDWLSEVMPKVHPYFPQVGDDLVYFRQGHERYMERVIKTRAYPVTNDTIASLPYRQDPDLPSEVSVKLTKITFKNYSPARVAILTLERVEWDNRGEPTGDTFLVHYHALSNLTDFLVLRQVYDYSLERGWKNGDRLRSLRGNSWRTGEIIQANVPYQASFPESHYLSFLVAWDDSGIYQRREPLSPWELDAITDELPTHNGTSASREELLAIMREIFPMKWEGQEKDSRRISSLLDFILELPPATQYLSPHAPDFDARIDYPMNLRIIKARFENSFYRSKEAILTDCGQLARNAAQCFPPDGPAVKSANVLSSLIQEIVRDVHMTQESLEKRYNILCHPDLENPDAFGVSKRRRSGDPVPVETLLPVVAASSSNSINRVSQARVLRVSKS